MQNEAKWENSGVGWGVGHWTVKQDWRHHMREGKVSILNHSLTTSGWAALWYREAPGELLTPDIPDLNKCTNLHKRKKIAPYFFPFSWKDLSWVEEEMRFGSKSCRSQSFWKERNWKNLSAPWILMTCWTQHNTLIIYNLMKCKVWVTHSFWYNYEGRTPIFQFTFAYWIIIFILLHASSFRASFSSSVASTQSKSPIPKND